MNCTKVRSSAGKAGLYSPSAGLKRGKEKLINCDWPGNVRQLKNVVQRLIIITDSSVLETPPLSDHWESRLEHPAENIPETLEALKAAKQDLLENQFGGIEKAFLKKALLAADGNITQAARFVGMQRSNFSALMKKHGLTTSSA